MNYHTPEELCLVKYNDLDAAIKRCVELLDMVNWTEQLVFGKSDLSNAFRLAPMKIAHCQWLTMKAKHPKTGKVWFFVDKCMPFGASISCAIFQAILNGLQHILDFTQRRKIYVVYMAITIYLDDFLFIAFRAQVCERMMNNFMTVCADIGVPVSLEKPNGQLN